MNRQEKQRVIDSIKNDFKASQASFIVTVQGMNVEAIQGLRKSLYSKGSTLKVAKNTLLKIATSDISGIEGLEPYFKDQIAVVFATQETPEVAKILFTVSKSNEKLTVRAGTLNGKAITAAQIEFLASLPAREVLLAHVCGTLMAPISAYVRILNQLIVRFLWLLKQLAEKKQ